MSPPPRSECRPPASCRRERHARHDRAGQAASASASVSGALHGLAHTFCPCRFALAARLALLARCPPKRCCHGMTSVARCEYQLLRRRSLRTPNLSTKRTPVGIRCSPRCLLHDNARSLILLFKQLAQLHTARVHCVSNSVTATAKCEAGLSYMQRRCSSSRR